MKDRDQKLLWEAYATEKKHSKPDFLDIDGDNDTDEPMAKAAKEVNDKKKSKKGDKKEMTDKQKKYFAKESGDYVEEERAYERPGLEHIQDATRNLTGDNSDDGDWEEAIRTTCQGIAEYIIFHADPPDADVAGAHIEGSVLTDPELADTWDFRTGVKGAISNLLTGDEYDQLSKGFKKAFHRAVKDKADGRFDFSNETLLDRLKANMNKRSNQDERQDDSRLSDMPPRDPGL